MNPKLQLVQIILQALSSFAIAGGLLFTAVQFRQARKAQLVANFSKLVELQAQLRYMRVQNPQLAAASPQDVENLKTDFDIQVYFLNLIQLSLFEIAWYAHKEKQLPEDYFQSWSRRMWEVSQQSTFKSMLENPSMKILHDDFDSYIRKLATSPIPPAAGNYFFRKSRKA